MLRRVISASVSKPNKKAYVKADDTHTHTHTRKPSHPIVFSLRWINYTLSFRYNNNRRICDRPNIFAHTPFRNKLARILNDLTKGFNWQYLTIFFRQFPLIWNDENWKTTRPVEGQCWTVWTGSMYWENERVREKKNRNYYTIISSIIWYEHKQHEIYVFEWDGYGAKDDNGDGSGAKTKITTAVRDAAFRLVILLGWWTETHWQQRFNS